MPAPEQMLKKDLVKSYREQQQEIKLLKRQLEEKKDDQGQIKGDVKAPVFFFDNNKRVFITAIANVNLNQLSEIEEHGVARHMAEMRVLRYCEEDMYTQVYEGEE